MCSLFLLLLFFASASAHETGDAPAPRGAMAGGIFIGELPCGDCAGLRQRLHLRSDGAFVLETTRLGEPQDAGNPVAVLGAWTESADGRRVELRRAGEPPSSYAISDPETLRKLDARGRPVGSKRKHQLHRSHAVEKFQPLLRLDGLYGPMADAGQFRECASRARFPVARAADYAALERGYAAARVAPGETLLVTVEARIAAQPSTAGDRLVDALVVERFVGAWPAETCGEPFGRMELTGTTWKLTRLGDQPVPVRPASAVPHLLLTAQSGGQASGFGGCNHFAGPFRQQGAALRLERIAATLMACAEGMEIETDFMQALEATVRWRVFGSHLELYDADWTLLARFEAQHEEPSR